MAHRRSLRWIGRGIAATALSATVISALPAKAAPWSGNRFDFVTEEFRSVWNETDANPGERGWTWGPRPWFDYKEFYKQSPRGLRQVQYLDKSRMEINNPSAPRGRFFVTNGLLPVEMVSGRVKLGDATTPDQNEQREPAQIPVAGDLPKVNPDAPTYASFRLVATTDNPYRDQNRLGQRVSATFDKAGNIGNRPDLARPETEIVAYNAQTGHNIPAVFKTYMDFYDRPGGVTSLFAFGLPITDPYWVRARVGGVEKDVMVQIFERRVLTYTPTNPAAFQVEMGNVGQHYFQWRYPHLGNPWEGQEPYIPLSFGSNRLEGDHWEIFTTNEQGQNQSNITRGTAESVPFSVLRSWDQTKVRLIGDSRRDAGGRRQLYSFSLDGSEIRRLHNSSGNDWNPAISPDGTKILFASDRDGNVEIWMLNLNGGGLAQLTNTAAPCVNEYPTWFPDGTAIAYNSNCQGNNWEVFVADLRYTQDKSNELQVALQDAENITNNAAADRFPRVAPSGNHIAFSSNRDGNFEIYIMRSRTGQALRRVTNSTGGDEGAPSWSPDGSMLVYDSNIEGDYEIYIRNFDGTGGQRQITDNRQDDRWPLWAQ